ncbi:MAG: type II toxin-antitoxin system RelE/ParE family toxin [Thermodesulfovibrionales bacterium]
MPKVEWTKDALDDLEKIDNSIVKRILNKISWFSDHFNSIIPEPLSGDLSGSYKFRIGDWRVIYTTETGVIVIQSVGHRREIYK